MDRISDERTILVLFEDRSQRVSMALLRGSLHGCIDVAKAPSTRTRRGDYKGIWVRCSHGAMSPCLGALLRWSATENAISMPFPGPL